MNKAIGFINSVALDSGHYKVTVTVSVSNGSITSEGSGMAVIPFSSSDHNANKTILQAMAAVTDGLGVSVEANDIYVPFS